MAGDVTANGVTADDVHRWLVLYAILDCLLAVLYSALAVAWVRRSGYWRSGRRTAAGLVVLGAVADFAENVMLATGASHPRLLLVCTGLKWLLLAAGAGTMAVCARHAIAACFRWTPKALYTHRYSVLVVLPLAALSVSRGPDILEQLPDIQRRWSDAGDWLDFVWAGIVMCLLVVLVLAVSRERTRHLALRVCPFWTEDDHPCDARGTPDDCPVRIAQSNDTGHLPLLRLWLVGPVLLVLAGLFLERHGHVSWWRLVGFVAVPLLVAGLSWALRARTREQDGNPERPDYRVRRAPIPVARYLTTARAGDVLVGCLPLIAGLGCIRAFTAPALLGVIEALGWFFLVAGCVTLLGAFPVLAVILRFVATSTNPVTSMLALATQPLTGRLEVSATTNSPATAREWLGEFLDQKVAWATLLAGLAGIGLVGCLPVWLAINAGVIASFQLALGSLCAVIAASVILVQRGEGPEVFWRLGLSYAPVTTLLLVVCLAIGLVGRWSDVHAIRTADPRDFPVTERPRLDTLFDNWLAAGTACAQQLPGTGLEARPLMLFAAEGGGIRAAYWTASAVDWIQTGTEPAEDPDPGAGQPVDVCRSAMLSSGASGGSVGLNVAAARGQAPATVAVRRIAGRRALGAASVGLVLRDTIFAATGVPLPSLADSAPGAFDWNDRGTLIEQAWEHRIGELEQPFLGQDRMTGWTWGPPGALVVNSTSTTTSCRMLLSQIALPDQGARCGIDAAVAGSADLVSCTGNLRYTTAALLTARFPYVTPSGVVTCPGDDSAQPPRPPATLQIVDGGYGDNAGVGTLVDLAPPLHGPSPRAQRLRPALAVGPGHDLCGRQHARGPPLGLLRQRHRLRPREPARRSQPRGAGAAHHPPGRPGQPRLRLERAAAGLAAARHPAADQRRRIARGRRRRPRLMARVRHLRDQPGHQAGHRRPPRLGALAREHGRDGQGARRARGRVPAQCGRGDDDGHDLS